MSEYPSGSVEDRDVLAKMPMKKFLDFLFLHVRNLWRVDGLYFLGIEKEFDTEAATEIDAGVWQIMAKIEAESLRRMFEVNKNADITTIMNLLQKSSWALDQPFKTIEISDNKAVLSIDRCRTQEARLKKGLGEFPCRKVRFDYLKNFARTLNSNVKVDCLVCPPDKHPPNLWCRWRFNL